MNDLRTVVKAMICLKSLVGHTNAFKIFNGSEVQIHGLTESEAFKLCFDLKTIGFLANDYENCIADQKSYSVLIHWP